MDPNKSVQDLLTVRDVAERYGVNEDMVRHHWSYRPEWPQVYKRAEGVAGTRYYLSGEVDRAVRAIREGDQEGWTLEDIAQRCGIGTKAVRALRAKYGWTPVGKRIRAYTYDPVEVEASLRREARLPEPEGDADDLLTWEGVCEYLGRGGVARSTLDWRRWRGLWPSGVVGADGVERWRRGDVEEAQRSFARPGQAKQST